MLLWRHLLVHMCPAGAWRSDGWRGASSPSSCSSCSLRAKQMAYKTASSVGRVLAGHNSLFSSGYFYYFVKFSVCSCRQGSLEGEALAAAVLSLLHTCQPYFNYVESTARSTVSQHTHLPRVQLLDFSEQLCDRLEQLVLTFASYNLLCLDETEPNGVSHFCIGQFQLSRLRMTIFRYCKPTPYLAQGDTGLYKCMRWNVERLRDKQQKDKDYFLCYEDIPNAHADADKDNQSVSNGSMVRMWSIGQWVQVYPDPDTEDICDWILCDVPQADYDRLLFLGSDEPSCCSALQKCVC
uniref:Si:ch211-214c7.5 n=1 Tax=Amphiprion percula TaxID=161767 RepID=A0A3P8RPB0_AMPPE